MKIFITALLVLTLPMLFTERSLAGSLDDLSAAIVYLQQDLPKTTEIEGKKYELWVKVSEPNKFMPLPPEQFSGSGSLVIFEGHLYLVTAEHVARQMSPTAKVVIKGERDVPFAIQLSELMDATTGPHWINHASADVSVLPIFIKRADLKKKLQNHFYSAELLEKNEFAPGREMSLTTVGFPLSLGIGGRFSPITKVSRPASGLLTLPRFDTKAMNTFFLLQDPSIGGFSGAPVLDLETIRVRGNNMSFGTADLKCYGIIHGTFSDNSGGKLAAVTPAAQVVETLQKAEEQVWGKVWEPKHAVKDQ